MGSDTTPQFHFDDPLPFSYEDFKIKFIPLMLQTFDGEGGAYLRGPQGGEADFLTRALYVMTVVKLQNPDMTSSQFMYAFTYGLARYFLDQGQTPASARAELSRVPWDTLPGLGDYNRETANAVAVRAFEDAVAGHPQVPPY